MMADILPAPARLGRNGHYAIVPGTAYAACPVGAPWCGWHGLPPGTWIYTDIRHVGDAPGHRFLPETGPDAADNRAINAVFRAPFRRLRATCRSGEPILEIRDAARLAHMRKRLRREIAAQPNATSIVIDHGEMGFVRLVSKKEGA